MLLPYKVDHYVASFIQKDVEVQAKNGNDQTALHIATHCGFVNTVITLLFEGNADVMALDHQNQTPLHLAKSSKILNILLSKSSANKVNSIYTDVKGNNAANVTSLSEDNTNSDTECIANPYEYICLLYKCSGDNKFVTWRVRQNMFCW